MIVEATANDIALAVPLLHEMQEDNRTLGRVCPHHFMMVWTVKIAAGDGRVLLSFDKDGDCDGILAGVLTLDPVTGVKVYQMSTAYARKDHKQPMMPLRMLRNQEKWAANHGARVMFCGSMAGDDRGTSEFLVKMGYKPSDQAFVKGLK
jgi:hypothetical protein